jgi:hypothetical protein
MTARRRRIFALRLCVRGVVGPVQEQVATMAIMGLEAAYKKLIAMKSLTALQDDGSWPAI